MVDVSVPAPDNTGVYFPDTVILYGVKLNTPNAFGVFDAGNTATLRMQLFSSGEPDKLYSIALGYAYAFEEHCYRLDTKRIFIVSRAKAEDAVGCGFEPPYKMWRLRSNEELLEITMNYGDVKKLILDANLPGRRSPSSYAITASLAHRDGRLNRD